MAFLDELEDDHMLSNVTDGLEHQGSYIYRPSTKAKNEGGRPSKRRKLARSSPSKDDVLPFVPLLEGREDPGYVKLRFERFQDFWASQAVEIQSILEANDSEVLAEIEAFVNNASSETSNGRLPAGLITLGSNFSSMGRLLERLRKLSNTDGVGGLVAIDSGDAPNLKTALKHIIRVAIGNLSDDDEEEADLLSGKATSKFLPYDLSQLHEHVERKGIQRLVIAFRDSDAYDNKLLADLLSLLSSWLDRIPFVALFGIATSVGVFEGRLPRSVVNLLQGRHFDIPDSNESVDRIFARIQTRENNLLWLGHNVSRILMDRSKDHFYSPESFSNCIKYGYMSHFFANPLSALISTASMPKPIPQELCEAIRHTPSFRKYVEGLLEGNHAGNSRSLLEDDTFLTDEVEKHIRQGQHRMNQMFATLESLAALLQSLATLRSNSMADLVIQALSGELFGSPTVQDMLVAVKESPSDDLQNLFAVLPSHFDDFEEDLESLVEGMRGAGPLRSAYDSRHSTHKTTVVGQKLKLTKAETKLSKQDSEYTKFVDRFVTALEIYFAERIVRPQDLFMCEVFVYDLKTPIKDVFAPRPRFTIERALSTPSDYLVSSSNIVAQNLSASQPATSILFQLYLESGALVNTYDLWRAFYMIVSSEAEESCDERQVLTLFYRALAELKMMGMVKLGKKKIDHLAKASWAGL